VIYSISLDELYINNLSFAENKSKFSKYVLEEWYNLHRGKTPKLDAYPNKYKFPIIKIIQ
jgi:hypothetical protein